MVGKQQQQQQLPSSQVQIKQSTSSHPIYGQPPLTTFANGFGTSIQPISTAHSISTPLVATPLTSQSALTNGSSSISVQQNQPVSTLPASLPHPPAASVPAVATPSTHLAHENASIASGRTNSPAVATSAVLSAVAPSVNGNSSATTVSSNGAGIGPYRPGYPPFLYAPYGNFHHTNPYIPPAISSPSASPRPTDARTNRESNLIAQNGMRSITPTATAISNGISSQLPSTQCAHSSQQQQMQIQSQPLSVTSNLREQSQATTPTHPQHSGSLQMQKSHSPRGHSPNRERDSYRYVGHFLMIIFLSLIQKRERKNHFFYHFIV